MSHRIPTRPRCHNCGRRVVCDFIVADWIWTECFGAIHGPGYRCLDCMAEAADERGIEWCKEIELRPVSLAAQRRVQEGVKGASNPRPRARG